MQSDLLSHREESASITPLSFGIFPKPDDPFHFIPCTNRTVPPALDDPDPSGTWAALFDDDPTHWSWGKVVTNISSVGEDISSANGEDIEETDPYAGRGIYLCGYLDVPLDYTNTSADSRIARLAVTKYQVSGLAPVVPAGQGTPKSTVPLWSAASFHYKVDMANPFGWDGPFAIGIRHILRGQRRLLCRWTKPILGLSRFCVEDDDPLWMLVNLGEEYLRMGGKYLRRLEEFLGRREQDLATTGHVVTSSAAPPQRSRPSASGGARGGRGVKSERTIIIEPGGPGGSGTSYAWRAAEEVTARLSDSKFDVLGWDPRGVNASLPAVACFPFDADRDRWLALTGIYRESVLGLASASSLLSSALPPSSSSGMDESVVRHQLELADAMNEATMRACRKRHGDIGRFVSTAFVARDMDRIREALGEDELTGYLVSYGTGIGQTYANMFPDRVGRMILDGTEYVRDHRLLGGFGWTALDNATDAWRDGFLGECIKAGPELCALAKTTSGNISLEDLEIRMATLIASLIERPMPGYSENSGPSLITYSAMVSAVYSAMYNARSWPAFAQMLHELEAGNSTLAAAFLDRAAWEYDPASSSAQLPSCSDLPGPPPPPHPASDELTMLVICADSYDAPQPSDGLDWWQSLWANMTTRNWIAGNSRFLGVLPCRHFNANWPEGPAEVFRGDLNASLAHPVLLIAETYDPATPLRNGRRLAREMGRENSRLIVHHGYGHSSRDTSSCTDQIARTYILTGELPEAHETQCYADGKPYLYASTSSSSGAYGYGVVPDESQSYGGRGWDPVREWRRHMRDVVRPRRI